MVEYPKPRFAHESGLWKPSIYPLFFLEEWEEYQNVSLIFYLSRSTQSEPTNGHDPVCRSMLPAPS